MDWMWLLDMPGTAMLAVAGFFLLLALGCGVGSVRRWRRRRRVAASWSGLWALVFLLFAALGAVCWLSLHGWHALADETPVLAIESHRTGNAAWLLQLRFPDGDTQQVTLHGDAWRVEAIVLKWKLPAVLAGVPPLYRLDRLSGRYDDPAEEAEAARTVVDFNRAGALDIALLRRQYTRWLPMVDTEFGSGAYLPLVDGGRYNVSLMRSGALVARRDDTTP